MCHPYCYQQNNCQQQLCLRPTNERMFELQVQVKLFTAWLLNAHAPMENKDNAVKDDFYSRVELVCHSLQV